MFRSSTFSPALGLAVACAAALLTSSPASASVTMDWATVGNASNAADPTTGFGAVSYEYRIAKHEVTKAQYTEFLNAVAASDPNNLYNTNMNSASGGITRSGSSGSFTYSVNANMADKPVNFVSWYDAARFSNWLTNGQGSGGTESGVYTMTGPTSFSAITRDLNDSNQVFLPTEEEWYKAAYHQPASQGGDSDDYWLYATQSNSVPTVATANSIGDIANPGANVANYLRGAIWNNLIGNVTTVGSAGNSSFYGAFDMSGNVWEWNESRVLRGGGLSDNSEIGMRSSSRSAANPWSENPDIGFRVASLVPGPGSVALLAVGAPLLMARRRRRG